MKVYQFPKTQRNSITGLFWMLPPAVQAQRIRQLAKSRFTPEVISTICRMPLSQVQAAIEGTA